ncbi:MAG: hypothetical protein JRJ49_03495 [Deltaproteobacteria bacterium]|nr:hypothetical protein [Deltaproteobacteria bacterium]
MKKLTIFLVIIFCLFLSAFAIADEKEIKKKLEDVKKVSQIKKHEENIQQKIDTANAEITEILSFEKISDKNFETVEQKKEKIQKYKRQLFMLKSERARLENEYRDPTAWMDKDIERMKKQKMSPAVRKFLEQ